MLEPERAAGERVQHRHIRRAVVGHDALDGDVVGGVEGHYAAQEGDRGGRLLVGEHVGVGEPCAVCASLPQAITTGGHCISSVSSLGYAARTSCRRGPRGALTISMRRERAGPAVRAVARRARRQLTDLPSTAALGLQSAKRAGGSFMADDERSWCDRFGEWRRERHARTLDRRQRRSMKHMAALEGTHRNSGSQSDRNGRCVRSDGPASRAP
jgi:hypothetical protein